MEFWEEISEMVRRTDSVPNLLDLHSDQDDGNGLEIIVRWLLARGRVTLAIISAKQGSLQQRPRYPVNSFRAMLRKPPRDSF